MSFSDKSDVQGHLVVNVRVLRYRGLCFEVQPAAAGPCFALWGFQGLGTGLFCPSAQAERWKADSGRQRVNGGDPTP